MASGRSPLRRIVTATGDRLPTDSGTAACGDRADLSIDSGGQARRSIVTINRYQPALRGAPARREQRPGLSAREGGPYRFDWSAKGIKSWLGRVPAANEEPIVRITDLFDGIRGAIGGSRARRAGHDCGGSESTNVNGSDCSSVEAGVTLRLPTNEIEHPLGARVLGAMRGPGDSMVGRSATPGRGWRPRSNRTTLHVPGSAAEGTMSPQCRRCVVVREVLARRPAVADGPRR